MIKTLDDLSVALHVSPWLHETFIMIMWFTLHIISDDKEEYFWISEENALKMF